MNTHTYKVIKAGAIIAADANYIAAVNVAKANGAEVWDSKPDGSPNLRRWHPVPVKAARRVRHVLVNADGTETEFSRVRR
jgi:hypothetical protein